MNKEASEYDRANEKEEKWTMTNLINRAKYAVSGEDGASNLEIIVWFSVVLVIATILFVFRDAITGFIEKATSRVANWTDGGTGSDK